MKNAILTYFDGTVGLTATALTLTPIAVLLYWPVCANMPCVSGCCDVISPGCDDISRVETRMSSVKRKNVQAATGTRDVILPT